MADFSILVTMPDFNELDGKKAMAILHDHAPEIAEEVLARIQDRSPKDTGALKGDETYKLGDGSSLVQWYVGADYQITEWGREYDVYQEGPPLGLSTYTTGEHQMFYRVTTDDLPLIADWAQRTVEGAAESMAEAAEAGATEWEM